MSDENDTTGSGLRAQLEAALEQIKVLKEANATAAKKAKAAEAVQFLKDKGVDVDRAQKIASKFIGPEVEDVKAWAEENAELFGLNLEGSGSPQDPVVSNDEVGEIKRIQSISQSGLPASKAADFEAKFKQAKTDAELDELWDQARQFLL